MKLKDLISAIDSNADLNIIRNEFFIVTEG